MKKLIILIIIALIPVISFSSVSAQQTATNENDACNGKKNGDACSYSTQTNTSTGPATQVTNGYCDRRGTINDSIFGGGSFYCNKDVNGWKGCDFPGDACELNGKLGVCPSDTGRGQGTCDTTKTPQGNPGGSTPPKCGTDTCSSNEVCANVSGAAQCVPNATGTTGNCGTTQCTPPKVCALISGAAQCVDNALTPGTPANNGTTPDATAPQTVGFTNPIRFSTIPELIAGIIYALLGILGAITVAVLVLSGFKYMTSSNPGEVGQALDGIKNAVVGLIIIMGAFLITQYVISALAV
jgi:hypothetical protein